MDDMTSKKKDAKKADKAAARDAEKAAKKAKQQAKKAKQQAKKAAKKAKDQAKKADKKATERAKKRAGKVPELTKDSAAKGKKSGEVDGKPEAAGAPTSTEPSADWTVTALRAYARAQSVPGYSRLTRDELLARYNLSTPSPES